MLRVWRASGEELTASTVNSEDPWTGTTLKQHLHGLCKVPRFRQRLLCEDGSILEEHAVIDKPMELQLVLLPFGKATAADASALTQAVYDNDTSVMEEILQRPQDPDLPDECGSYALGLAVALAYGEAIALLLEAGADKNNISSRDYCEAVMSGSTELVSWLFEMGCDVNRANWCGQTPAMLASYFGQEEMAKVLESWSVYCKADRGYDLAYHASRQGQTHVLKRLLEWGADPDHLLAALEEGHADVLEMLLSAGADVDKLYSGTTALYVACENCRRAPDRLDLVKLLLDYGADKQLPTPSGDTPVKLAKRSGLVDVLIELQKTKR